jgi:hypothetical protein
LELREVEEGDVAKLVVGVESVEIYKSNDCISEAF